VGSPVLRLVIVHPSDRPGSGLGRAAGVVADLSIEAVLSIFAEYGLDLELVRRGEADVTSGSGRAAPASGSGPAGRARGAHST
jgi:hypothetical protein